MTGQDETMARIAHAMETGQQGDRERARRLFAQIWEELGPNGDPLHRCALAHWMADVQDDPSDELVWDLRALEAAHLLTDERVSEAGAPNPVAGFYPSLHLNLGEVYRKLGDIAAARHHVALGRRAADALPADGYGTMIRRGLDGLADRLP